MIIATYVFPNQTKSILSGVHYANRVFGEVDFKNSGRRSCISCIPFEVIVTNDKFSHLKLFNSKLLKSKLLRVTTSYILSYKNQNYSGRRLNKLFIWPLH